MGIIKTSLPKPSYKLKTVINSFQKLDIILDVRDNENKQKDEKNLRKRRIAMETSYHQKIFKC